MKRIFIKNATIVNENKQFRGSVVLDNGIIVEILSDREMPAGPCDKEIDATGCYLLPGIIDEHVHFRDPGYTYKADVETESCAAAAGGVTSIMDMPNNYPQTITIDALNAKLDYMAEHCIVNYSCYFGATNTNSDLLDKLDNSRVCGIKIFMGSSTGNMLVDNDESLERIFKGTNKLIATHCEDQKIINENTQKIAGDLDDVPITQHPYIRSPLACFKSTSKAIKLATETGARLHILHISTSAELKLLKIKPFEKKRITAEVCIPHLIFSSRNYHELGSLIKCNPAIKRHSNEVALQRAINSSQIDTIATDHAPHLLSEKQGGALKARSGIPMIQFSLVCMLELVSNKITTIETLVEKMCHNPALIYGIRNRGFIRQGYQADLVLVRPDQEWTLTNDCILSKCKWSPLEGRKFTWKVEQTFVNGELVYTDNEVNKNCRGQELIFER
ncbi:MAG: dihydroorotase [Bacteroidaceae bacterium]|nr:dihydroorotase [Bacteroidaceae bacterium]